MDEYIKGPLIGEGTYGSVISATHRISGQKVAIKKIRLGSSRDGIQNCAIREIKALKELRSPHIVQLLEVFPNKTSLAMVFEYMDFSLEDVIRDKANVQLSPADVKAYMQMLLQALQVVHSHELIHRDVKPDNLLMSADGQLKLADFGLTSSCDPEGGKMTHAVFGRWYRAPELLFASTSYGTEVDMWAAGCVFAELLLRRPWFQGSCDMDQLDRIFKVLGVPPSSVWPPSLELAHQMVLKPAPGQPLQEVFPEASPAALDLLQQLVALEPQRRPTAAAALAHPFFSEAPPPTPKQQLPRPQQRCRGVLQMVPGMLRTHACSAAAGGGGGGGGGGSNRGTGLGPAAAAAPGAVGVHGTIPAAAGVRAAPGAAAGGEEDHLQPFSGRMLHRCMSAPEVQHFSGLAAAAAAAAGGGGGGGPAAAFHCLTDHPQQHPFQQRQQLCGISAAAGGGAGVPAAAVADGPGAADGPSIGGRGGQQLQGVVPAPHWDQAAAAVGGGGGPLQQPSAAPATGMGSRDYGSTRQQLFRSPVGGADGVPGSTLPPRHSSSRPLSGGRQPSAHTHHYQQQQQLPQLQGNQENMCPSSNQQQQQQLGASMRPPARRSRQLSDLSAALNKAADMGEGAAAAAAGAACQFVGQQGKQEVQSATAAAAGGGGGYRATDGQHLLLGSAAGEGRVQQVGLHELPPLLQQQHYRLLLQQQQQQWEAQGESSIVDHHSHQQQQQLGNSTTAAAAAAAASEGGMERQRSGGSSVDRTLPDSCSVERNPRRLSDEACPMSLSRSEHKRTRAAFESAVSEGGAGDGLEGAADEAQPMSVGMTQRKLKRPSLSRAPTEDNSIDKAPVAAPEGPQPSTAPQQDSTVAVACIYHGPLACVHSLDQQQQQQRLDMASGLLAPGDAGGPCHCHYHHQQQQHQQCKLEQLQRRQQAQAAFQASAAAAQGHQLCGPSGPPLQQQQPQHPNHLHPQQRVLQHSQLSGVGGGCMPPPHPHLYPAGVPDQAERAAMGAGQGQGALPHSVALALDQKFQFQAVTASGQQPGTALQHHDVHLQQQHQQHLLEAPDSSMAMHSARSMQSGGGGGGSGWLARGGGGCSSVAPSSAGGSAWPMSVDHLDLEHLAEWQRPKLSSSEMKYLRKRTLDVDEALFWASQQGPNESPLPGARLEYEDDSEEEEEGEEEPTGQGAHSCGAGTGSLAAAEPSEAAVAAVLAAGEAALRAAAMAASGVAEVAVQL